jgi:hypothetical protein
MMNSAFGTLPFPQALAKALALSSVDWDVCRAAINSTSFCQSFLEGKLDGPTTRSAYFLPCSELADTPSGMVAAAIFVMLIDDVFDAMMQSGFTASGMDLNNVLLSWMFSETAYGDHQGEHTWTGIDEVTSITMSVSLKPSIPWES